MLSEQQGPPIAEMHQTSNMTITINDTEAAQYLERLKKYEYEMNRWADKKLHADSATLVTIMAEHSHGIALGEREMAMEKMRRDADAFISANPKPKPPSIIPNV